MLHSVQHSCCIAGATCFHHIDVLQQKLVFCMQHNVVKERYYIARMIQACFTLRNMSYGTRKGGY